MAPKAGTASVTEIERKLDVEPGFELPELTDLGSAAAGISAPEPVDLRATYFDSPDLRLIRQAMTLRRRTGGDDEGWHLKRPRPDGERDELHRPLGRSRSVPKQLRQEVEVHLRGAPLVPVVELATHRVLRTVLAPDGTVLAEVADDSVTATRPGAEPLAWRELEVELKSADHDLLAVVVERLLAAGARPSGSRSKLARALAEPPRPVRPLRPPGVRRASAAAAVLTHLEEQAARLEAADPALRSGDDGALRTMWQASGRLAAALAVFAPLFERSAAESLRAELEWFAAVLAPARDAEVVRGLLTAGLAGEPPELIRGPVARRAVSAMRARQRQARQQVLAELDGERYFALLDRLDGLLATPPLTALALDRREMVLPGLVERAWRRVAQLIRAEAAAKEADREQLRAELQLVARYTRYAGKALVPGFGKQAAEFAARMKALQEAAGYSRDAALAAATLVDLADQAQAAGESSFTHGRLHAQQQERIAQVEQQLSRAWRRASRPDHRRWLQ